jgi:hypothetical protein
MPLHQRLPAEPPISPIEAAERQLKTAIVLFFKDGDAVSIHTLAMAACELVAKACKRRGIESLHSMFFERVKPEFRKEAANRMNEARNFFKHGSQDGKPLEGFADDRNDFVIFEACFGLDRLEISFREMRIFNAWFVTMNPHLMIDGPEKNDLIEAWTEIPNADRATRKYIGRRLLKNVS